MFLLSWERIQNILSKKNLALKKLLHYMLQGFFALREFFIKHNISQFINKYYVKAMRTNNILQILWILNIYVFFRHSKFTFKHFKCQSEINILNFYNSK